MTVWRKSSRSSNGTGQCVEVACLNDHPWRKSSRSSNGTAQCVEVAPTAPATVAVRDSKNSAGHDYPVLTLTTPAWSAFLADLRTGRLDTL
ncbi:DUF397 domain-containing protein [Phytomonospora sp. NPDC050363]|uniref:DUF397 domain-containing protein n=1 Tax=Phytomonospora sp. NPDC050363 TaxID=3155642 RepID=UPI0033F99A22